MIQNAINDKDEIINIDHNWAFKVRVTGSKRKKQDFYKSRSNSASV